MKMNPQTKFTVTNVLFFGVVGSLIGGVIPAMLDFLTREPSPYQLIIDEGLFDATRRSFMDYVLVSLVVGLTPASIAGYLYADMYKNEYIASGAVNFWKELKFGAIGSFWAILGCCIFLFIIMVAGTLSQSIATIRVVPVVFLSVFGAWVILTFLGVISGMACSNLIREWNQKLVANLS